MFSEERGDFSQAAYEAWLQLFPRSSSPREVTPLKETTRTNAYKLEGVGPGGGTVVAKHCRKQIGQFESLIYNEVLPKLPLKSLRCYGFLEEGENECGWIFLEDGGVTRIGEHEPRLQAPISRWLGTLHASASLLVGEFELPLRGPDYYLRELRLAQENIGESLGNPELTADDRTLLDTLLASCDSLEEGWDKVREHCDGLPWTLVHCDFQAKNILTRQDIPESAFLVVDWEYAGWGPPAPDLGGIDIISYWLAAREAGVCLELRCVERQARCGSLLQTVAWTNWEALRLARGGTERAMRRLRVCARRLTEFAQSVGIEA